MPPVEPAVMPATVTVMPAAISGATGAMARRVRRGPFMNKITGPVTIRAMRTAGTGRKPSTDPKPAPGETVSL
jgi:hypothetical protein